MQITFRAYGLRLGANRCIPGLTPDASVSQVDVQVQLGSLPSIARGRDPDEEWPEAVAGLPGGGRGFRLCYEDGTVFIVDERGSRIWGTWPESSSLADTAVYLLGPVLALTLRLRGVTCLHASAFVLDGAAVALVGPSGAGKSTAAAAFAARGAAVLCDDLLALSSRGPSIVAQPGYPRLRLWPEAAAMLYGHRETLPPLTPNWDKRFLDLQSRAKGFRSSPVALAAVYLLGEQPDHARAPRVESFTASQALLALLANCRSELGAQRRARRRDFHLLGQLVRRVPVRRLAGRAGVNSLSRLCDVISEDLQFMHERAAGGARLSCTI